MPYGSVKELPDAVKALPSHARKIWMSAFNTASKQYDKEEQAFRVAWSAIQKAGYRKKGDRWVRMKEADADDEALSTVEQAWIDGAVAAMIEERGDPLTEQYEDMPPSHAHDQMRMALHGAVCLLADSGTALTPDDKDALASIIARMSKRLAAGEGMTEAVDLTVIQEAIEALIVEDALQEAGQKHTNQDYELFDNVLNLLKQLRGQSPKELQAEQQQQAEEAAAQDPTTQMLDGYHGSQAVVAMHESASHELFREAVEILQEASGDGSGREWDVCIIQAGLSKNGRQYPLSVLQQAAPLFEGAKVYTYDRLLKGREIFDHLSEDEVRSNPQGYAKDLVGIIRRPRVDGSRLIGTLALFKSGQWLGENLRDAMTRGLPIPYGLSIDAGGDGHTVVTGGQPVKMIDAIREVRSVDVVTHPAAGGGFMRLVASHRPTPDETSLADVTPMLEALQAELRRTAADLQMGDLLADLEITGSPRQQIMNVFRDHLHAR